jgi:FKBP-type peptidyl-prolyl cis-trans isomerase
MDKFSYAIGLGIGQNLLSMGAKGIAVDDFAQAIKDVLEGNQTAISHQEAREIVNKYFEELEQKMNWKPRWAKSPSNKAKPSSKKTKKEQVWLRFQADSNMK